MREGRRQRVHSISCEGPQACLLGFVLDTHGLGSAYHVFASLAPVLASTFHDLFDQQPGLANGVYPGDALICVLRREDESPLGRHECEGILPAFVT